MNPDFALHIDCYKIITWLEQRKKLPKDWQTFVKAAEVKSKALAQRHTQLEKYHDIHKFVQDRAEEGLTYSDVLWLCAELEKSELAAQRNILGQYTHPLLKEWIALRKFMQNKLTGLLIEAKYISQVLKFEIPGLKKTAQSINNQVGLLRRKIDSNRNLISLQKEEFVKECRQLGIKGQNFRKEIPQLIELLPGVFREFQALFKNNVDKVLTIYSQFCKLNGCNVSSFDVTQYFLKNGDDFIINYENKASNISQQALNARKYEQFVYKDTSDGWDIQVDEPKTQQLPLDTILSSSTTRQELLNELTELYYFILARKLEHQNTASSSLMLVEYSKIDLQQQLISQMLPHFQKMLNLLAGPRTTDLLNLKTSNETYQRIVNKLDRYGQNQKRLLDDIDRYGRNIQQLEESLKEISRKTTSFKDSMTKSKLTIEQQITILMKRESKIVGDINKT